MDLAGPQLAVGGLGQGCHEVSMTQNKDGEPGQKLRSILGGLGTAPLGKPKS